MFFFSFFVAKINLISQRSSALNTMDAFASCILRIFFFFCMIFIPPMQWKLYWEYKVVRSSSVRLTVISDERDRIKLLLPHSKILSLRIIENAAVVTLTQLLGVEQMNRCVCVPKQKKNEILREMVNSGSQNLNNDDRGCPT